jgi:hypothetical protein
VRKYSGRGVIHAAGNPATRLPVTTGFIAWRKGATIMIRAIRFAAFLAGATLAFAATAQPAYDSGNYADPSSRVARLSYIQGNVSFVPAGENDWVEAQLNRPLITGDKLWTDRNSRAVLEIGAAAVRMDQNTAFDFLNLTDDAAQMELTQGTLNLRVRRLYDGQSYEIDTPTLAFVINRVGESRIDVEPDGVSTIVTVLSGGGDVYGENGARFAVEEGQSVEFRDPHLRDYRVADLPRTDAFDDFCHERDIRWDDSNSRRYVSEEVIGYQDLDNYGEWSDVPDYGYVWYPTSVAAGWSPYRFGHWAWVGAYGWTWIDNAPWGFAPFHYGRWAYIGNRWGWCPGPIHQRPVYAPALVAFVGGFGGLRISVGGPIGWFPLGPRDVYFPSYHVSERYFSRVNVSNTIVNTTIINNYYGDYSRGKLDYAGISYANRQIAGAVTAVSTATFVNSRPVAKAAIAINRADFAKARVHGFAAVAPTRASIARPTAARATPAAAVLKRPVVAATRPPAPVASFTQHRAALDKNPGRPLSVDALRVAPTAATATAGRKTATPAVVARPNVRVVTEHGSPMRTAAPVLPARTATSTRAPTPVDRANPVAREVTPTRVPSIQHDKPAPTRAEPVRSAPTHLDSTRFAHPQGASGERTSTPTRVTTNPGSRISTPTTRSPSEATHVQRNASENRVTTMPRSTYRAPERSEYQAAPPPQRQEYRAPAQPTYRAPERSEYHAAPQPQRQEYRAPAQPTYRAPEPARQEYHAPVQQQQMYRAPAQSQPSYRAAPAPHQNAQPAQRATPTRHNDDNKDHDRRH